MLTNSSAVNVRVCAVVTEAEKPSPTKVAIPSTVVAVAEVTDCHSLLESSCLKTPVGAETVTPVPEVATLVVPLTSRSSI